MKSYDFDEYTVCTKIHSVNLWKKSYLYIPYEIDSYNIDRIQWSKTGAYASLILSEFAM